MNKQDIETVIKAFYNVTLARERGIYFDEVYYKCLRSDENSIYAKDENQKGLILVNTSRCILLATYKENMQPSICVEATEKLGTVNI